MFKVKLFFSVWQFTGEFSHCYQSSAIVQAQHYWNNFLPEEITDYLAAVCAD